MPTLVVETEYVERAILRADVDLTKACPEAAGRGRARHPAAAGPEPLPGRAVVRVQYGGRPAAGRCLGLPGGEREHDAVDGDRCAWSSQVVRGPRGLERE